MGLTDGENLVMCPASYDYPFRFENDTGPGTGGMGCFTGAGGKLPFLADSDIDDCETIIRRALERLAQSGVRFNGVLNGGFFKTVDGILFMEFNSRFGDPEALNVLTILQGSFADILRSMYSGNLSADAVSFIPEASAIKYLVAPEYPDASPTPSEFLLDCETLGDMGLNVLFGACEHMGDNRFKTLNSSRVLAVGATADNIAAASELINQGINGCVSGDLKYRADIGSQVDIYLSID